jgi:hypothetical protein
MTTLVNGTRINIQSPTAALRKTDQIYADTTLKGRINHTKLTVFFNTPFVFFLKINVNLYCS